MKYYEELNKLDTSLIKLELIRSNLKVITDATEFSNSNDITSALYNVYDIFEQTLEQATDEFSNLFEVIRDDTMEYGDSSENKLGCTKQLDDTIRKWIESDKTSRCGGCGCK